MAKFVLDQLEANLIESVEDAQAWIDYVGSGFPAQASRIRSFLREQAKLTEAIGPIIGLLALELSLSNQKGTDLQAVQTLRRFPRHSAVEQLLNDPDRFQELSTTAHRLNEIDRELKGLQETFDANEISTDELLEQLGALIRREPLALGAQRLFFKIASTVGVPRAAREMAEHLAEKTHRISDLGLVAGKVLEAGGDVQGAINMYILGVTEIPQNLEVSLRLKQLVARHPAVTAAVRERLDIIRPHARDPRLVEQIGEELDQLPQAVAPPHELAARLVQAGSVTKAARHWTQWARAVNTYEAYLEAGLQAAKLGKLGPAKSMFGYARNLNRNETKALQALNRLNEQPAAQVTAPIQQTESVAEYADVKPPPETDLPHLAERVAQADPSERRAAWQDLVKPAQAAKRFWLAAAANALQQGAPLPQSVLTTDGVAAGPTLADVRLLARAGLHQEGTFAWLRLAASSPLYNLPHFVVEFHDSLPLDTAKSLASNSSTSELLTCVAVGTLDLSAAADLGVDSTDAARVRGKTLLLLDREEEGLRTLNEGKATDQALVALLRGEHSSAVAHCRPLRELQDDVVGSLGLPAPRRIQHSSDDRVVEHARVAWSSWEASKAKDITDLERHAHLEEAAFRYALAGQAEGRDKAMAWYNEGLLRLKLDALEQASACLTKCFEPMRNDAAVRWAIAVCEYRRGRLRDAFTICEQLAERDHNHADASLLAATIASVTGQHRKAVHFLATSIPSRKRPVAIELAIRAADRLASPRVWEQVRTAFDPRTNHLQASTTTVRQVPADRLPSHAASSSVNDKPLPKTALEHDRPTHQATPNEPSSFADPVEVERHCTSLMENGEVSEALRIVARQLKAKPKSKVLRYLRCRLMAADGQCKKAVDTLLNWAKNLQGPRRATIMRVVADCHLIAGDGKKAINVIDHDVVRDLPNDRQAKDIRRKATQLVADQRAPATKPIAEEQEGTITAKKPATGKAANESNVTQADKKAAEPPMAELPPEYLRLPPHANGRQLGRFYERLAEDRRFEELVASLKDLCKKKSLKFIPPRQLLGQLLVELGRTEEAEEILLPALSRCRAEFVHKILQPLLEIYLEQDRITDALTHLGSADLSCLMPRDVSNRFLNLFGQLADRDESQFAAVMLAKILFRGGGASAEEASRLLQSAYQVRSSDKRVKELAKKHHVKLKRDRLSAKALRSQWTKVYRSRGQFDEAMDLVRRHGRSCAKSEKREYVELEADILLHQGKEPQALEVWREFAQQSKDRRDWLEVASLYAKTGQQALEIPIYRKLLEQNPFDTAVYEALDGLRFDLDAFFPTRDLKLMRQCEQVVVSGRAHDRERLYNQLSEMPATDELSRVVVTLQHCQPDVAFWRYLTSEMTSAVETPTTNEALECQNDKAIPTMASDYRRPSDERSERLEQPGRTLRSNDESRRVEEERRRRKRVAQPYLDNPRHLREHWHQAIRDICPEFADRVSIGSDLYLNGRLSKIGWSIVDGANESESPLGRLNALVASLWIFTFAGTLRPFRPYRRLVGRNNLAAIVTPELTDNIEKQVLTPALELLRSLPLLTSAIVAGEITYLLRKTIPFWARGEQASTASMLYRLGEKVEEIVRARSLQDRRVRLDTAGSQCRQLIEKKFSWVTPSAQKSVRKLVSQWLDSLTVDYPEVSAAARLEVAFRKLTSREADSRFVVRCEISNIGEDVARDVQMKLKSIPGLDLDQLAQPIRELRPHSRITKDLVIADPHRSRQSVSLEGELRFVATSEGLRDVFEFGQVVLPPWSDVPKVKIEENPYKIGDPLIPSDSAFIHRRDLTELIRRTLGTDGRNNVIMLHGLRRVGKTTLINELIQQPPTGCISLFIDMERFKASDYRTGRFLRAVARDICDKARTHGVDLDLAPIEQWEKYPTVEFDDFRRQAGRKIQQRFRILMIFDEFEIFVEKISTGHFEQELLAVLRGIMQHERWMGFVIVGSNRIRDLVRSQDSTLFNLFAQIPVGLLSEQEARLLIRRPLEGRLSFEDSAVDLLVHETAGHAYLLQRLCHDLVEWLNKCERPHAADLDVRKVIQRQMEADQAGAFTYYSRLFDNLGLRPRDQLVLAVIANLTERQRRCTLEEVRQRLAEEDLEYPMDFHEFESALRRLQELTLVDSERRTGGGKEYGVQIPLFGHWIRRWQDLERLANKALEESHGNTTATYDSGDHEEGEDEPLLGSMQFEEERMLFEDSSDVSPELNAGDRQVGKEEVSATDKTATEDRHNGRVNSPYIVGSPVSEPGQFFGRSDFRRSVETDLLRTPSGHIEICGPRRMGKTSLLQFTRKLITDSVPNAITVFWCSSRFTAGDWSDFLQQFYTVIRQGAKDAGLDPPPVNVRDHSSAVQKQEDLEGLLKFIKKQGRRLYVLLDEFQGFITKGKLSKEELSCLRGFSQDLWAHDLSYTIATTIPLAEFSQDAVSSEFDNIFEFFPCGPLDQSAAIELVDTPARDANLELPDDAGRRIYKLCGGHPYLTSSVAQRLSESLRVASAADFDWELFEDQYIGSVAVKIERLLRYVDDDDVLRQKLERHVQGHYSQPYPKFKASQLNWMTQLERTGAFIRSSVDGRERLVPIGWIVRNYLDQRFNLVPQDRLADEEQINQLVKLICAIEPELRSVVQRHLSVHADEENAWDSDGLLEPSNRAHADESNEPASFAKSILALLKLEPFVSFVEGRGIRTKSLKALAMKCNDIRNAQMHGKKDLTEAEVIESINTITTLSSLIHHPSFL
ncbi:MAG: hypothetical protein H8E66_01145 [Planctomycetes bacterium]|nr:hypothetical protein [Planctomycetota bacterium]